jgi:hypothetical protein
LSAEQGRRFRFFSLPFIPATEKNGVNVTEPWIGSSTGKVIEDHGWSSEGVRTRISRSP